MRRSAYLEGRISEQDVRSAYHNIRKEGDDYKFGPIKDFK